MRLRREHFCVVGAESEWALRKGSITRWVWVCCAVLCCAVVVGDVVVGE